MSRCKKRRNDAGIRHVMIAVLIGSVVGCNAKAPAPPPSTGTADETSGSLADAPGDPRLHQSFQAATLSDPPNEDQRLPETTMAGQSVGKLYTEVLRLWDGIRFVNAAGKRPAYRATLETELGPIEIALLPDIAPNHVRNFIALTRA